MKRVMDIAAVAAVISIVLYAFTGVGAWAPLQPEDGFGRFVLLSMSHLAPIVYAGFRRT